MRTDELQAVLLTLASASRHVLVNQMVLMRVLPKDLTGLSEGTRKLFADIVKSDEELLKLIGETGARIARIR